nr:hypothetical protein [Desulfobacterales bacterium]
MRSWGIIIIQGLFIFILCVTGLIIPSISCSASSNCSVPPFVATGVKPNVIIMLDNSGSMKVPMYNDTDFGGWRCNNGTHDDFDPSQTYYGIFDSNKKYRYDSAIPVDPDPWQSGDPYKISVDTTMKGAFVEDNSCTCGSGKNCWDGNFLNWLVTRRIDAARKALVGGKMESRAGYDYITGDGGDLEWKILGNNEPSDGDFCKKYSNSSSYSPFPDNTTFKIYSPANNGSVKSSYDPYAKIEAQGSVAITIKDSSGKDIGEIGTVSIKHHWVTVDLCRKYTDPIVVAGPLSYNGSDPSLVRIKNVTSRSFKIRVQEWMYKDGTHTTEYVHY